MEPVADAWLRYAVPWWQLSKWYIGFRLISTAVSLNIDLLNHLHLSKSYPKRVCTSKVPLFVHA